MNPEKEMLQIIITVLDAIPLELLRKVKNKSKKVNENLRQEMMICEKCPFMVVGLQGPEKVSLQSEQQTAKIKTTPT